MLICSCILLIVGIVVAYIIIQENKIDTFSVSDYQISIDNYALYYGNNEFVEPIKNKKEAQIQAKKLWTKLYGKESVEVLEICTVYYDGGSDCWLVEGKPPYLKYLGGELSMIASSDGKVLAVWAVK